MYNGTNREEYKTITGIHISSTTYTFMIQSVYMQNVVLKNTIQLMEI